MLVLIHDEEGRETREEYEGNGWIWERANTYELWVSRKFAASRRDSDVSISEAVERKVVRRPGASTTEWRKELRGDRDYVGKIPGKIHERGGPENLRLLNYREIIKSIPVFTTPYCRPITIFGTISKWKTRCNNLTTCWAISIIFQIFRALWAQYIQINHCNRLQFSLWQITFCFAI